MLLNGRYLLLSSLYQGELSQVFLGRDLYAGKKVVAVKVITAERLSIQSVYRFKNEFLILTRLRHPNLVEVLDFGFDREHLIYYMVMEFLPGVRLSDYFLSSPFTPKKDGGLLIEILRGLEFIHSRQILYRDFKPDNVMLSRNHIKLLDFGLSDLTRCRNREVKGTLAYLAPEIIRKELAGRQSDLFAFGMLLYECLAGQGFYSTDELGGMLRLALDRNSFEAKLNSSLFKIEDKALRRVLKKALAFDPRGRYRSAALIIEALNLCWRRNFQTETTATVQAYLASIPYLDAQNQLYRSVKELKQQKNSLTLCAGKEGSGRSRFLDELNFQALLRNLPVWRFDRPDNPGEIVRTIEQKLSVESRLHPPVVLLFDNLPPAFLKGLLPHLALVFKQKKIRYCKIFAAVDSEQLKISLLRQLSDWGHLMVYRLTPFNKQQHKKYLARLLGTGLITKTALNQLCRESAELHSLPVKLNSWAAGLFKQGLLFKSRGFWQFGGTGGNEEHQSTGN